MRHARQHVALLLFCCAQARPFDLIADIAMCQLSYAGAASAIAA